jgi:hypothetical protein
MFVMCNAPEHIKLSKSAIPLKRLKNYWIFYRYRKNAPEALIIGEQVTQSNELPIHIDEHNRKALTHLLNLKDSFTTNLLPHENDRLLLCLSCKTVPKGQIDYLFKFHRNKWISSTLDPYNWLSRHEEEAFGKLVKK